MIFAAWDDSLPRRNCMQTKASVIDSRLQRRLAEALGLYALLAGALSFSGWPFNVPRLTDWFNDGVSIQPNTAVLIATAGVAVLLLPHNRRITLALGVFVAFAGAMNLLQYVV